MHISKKYTNIYIFSKFHIIILINNKILYFLNNFETNILNIKFYIFYISNLLYYYIKIESVY